MKNKKLYYFLNLTWGLPLTLFGVIIALMLIIAGKRPKHHGGCLYFNIGKSWGGLELGLFFLTDESDSEHVKNHEFGHSIQNAWFGILMPFIVSMPSAARYWYRRLRTAFNLSNPPYDSIWFEGWATKLGYENIGLWDSKPNRFSEEDSVSHPRDV